ncbi:retron St85 family effector protein [Neorhizobium sp. BETTINA12A]|uniref:retron St85 family effector protein n=1 Tax=Neorhizobium sp. BETTINA12A TaxID=2908924 RepID=UPI001FF63CBB|nr:retron St85 family effector protein [Neorhizobium sp. BETTINA12A]MCJ9754470.1 retron St85 family effector protein [Neorhizobium sp. BETTINA12A]
MPLPAPLLNLYNDIDLDAVHVRRVKPFVFLCGGHMAGLDGKPASLRKYLLKTRGLQNKIKAKIVLAEEANQLYRDTEYSDLITFEEDIAVISSMVLLIAESAGSLAELGAFATSDQIRPALSVIMTTAHFEQESFVRFGPIQKVLTEDEARIAAFPWRTRRDGEIIKSSVSSHFHEIQKFINNQIKSRPTQFLLRNSTEFSLFIKILWVIHLSRAIGISELHRYLLDMGNNIAQKEVKNKLYCMKIAGWIDKYTYSNKAYWHPLTEQDPFARYSYKAQTADRDTVRRKLEVTEAVKRDLRPPTHVLRHVASVMEAD